MSFPTYEAYKSTEVPEVPSVPSHWRFVPATAFSRFKKVTAPAEKLKNQEIFLYSIPSVQESGDGERVDGASIESDKLFLEGEEVLISKLNPRKNTVVLTQKKDIPVVCSGEFIPLKVERADPKYVMYLFWSYPTKERLSKLVQSVTKSHQRVNASDIYKLKQPLPPLEEQQKIGQFLDHQTVKIDRLIRKQRRLIDLLEEKRQAVTSEVITKGLNPNVPMKDSGIAWLGQVPAHWEVKRLMHLTPKYRRIMYGIILPGPHYEGGVPIVKGGDVKEHRLSPENLNRTDPEIEASYGRSRLKPGDLVFAIRGGVGDVEIVPKELEGANLTQDAARVAPGEDINSEWLYFALKAEPVVSQLKAGILGATVTGINIWDLKRVKLPVPPKMERDHIASYLNDQVGKFERTKSKAQVAIERLLEHRNSLVSSAVTGKIDVRDWEPPETELEDLDQAEALNG